MTLLLLLLPPPPPPPPPPPLCIGMDRVDAARMGQQFA